MNKHVILTTLAACVLIAFAATAATVNAEPASVNITITPSVLVLGEQGEWVTVHTDVPFSAVDTGAGISLDGIDADVITYDALGNLVGKFDQNTFKEKYQDCSDPSAISLLFEGTYDDGTSFQGEDTITVKEKGKK